MRLTEDDKNKIAEWIREKIGHPRCTMCGMGQWTLLDGATLPLGFDVHSTRFFYHQGIPQVSIACNNCGHMVLFHTGVIGFRPDEPEEEVVPEETPPNEPAETRKKTK